MKLWLISQTENSNYDTYDSAVVAAKTGASAKRITPDGWEFVHGTTWASSPKNVTVKLIGTASPGTEAGVILASFNAG